MGEMVSKSAIKKGLTIEDAFKGNYFDLPRIGFELTDEEYLDLIKSLVSDLSVVKVREPPNEGSIDHLNRELLSGDLVQLIFQNPNDLSYSDIFYFVRFAPELWYSIYLNSVLSDDEGYKIKKIEGKYFTTVEYLSLLLDRSDKIRQIGTRYKSFYYNLTDFPIYFQKEVDGKIVPDQKYNFADFKGRMTVYPNSDPLPFISRYYFNDQVLSKSYPLVEDSVASVNKIYRTEIYSLDIEKLFDFTTINGVKHGVEYRWCFIMSCGSKKYWWFGKLVTEKDYYNLLRGEIQRLTGLVPDIADIAARYY